MSRFKRMIIPLLLLYSTAALAIIFVFPVHGTGANEVQGSVSITTSPTKVLFDLSNMKPGDSASRVLGISNDGTTHYNYHSEVRHTRGSELLFKQFELYVLQGEETLYSGSMADFTGFEPRYLESGSSEEFIMTAVFPWESGNEFQGLETDFEIVLWAETTPVPSPDDPSIPSEPTEGQEKDESAGPPTVPGGSTPTFGGGLPQTGDQVPYLYYLMGAFLIASGFYLYQMRRRNKVKVQH
ncbi:LPXTG cell wall anchor domain-containing protein [Bacillus sp. H-16]|uniref:LPXTG cell wall anchor domain-containing protein n=1 Tax=Alteribacter salitolerans TaxID=2912333 RepID=UPI0019666677|nr:LPXTG cell wall anchor domain-containing protein [Alteribacter salitolerans]MBM7097058.1 LPXTG cell wall anchor domain-containing protein [Alteribacter salitolerans]